MIRLYEHPVSGNSHKIRLLLSFLDIQYESIVIDLANQEQRDEDFLSINPRGEVPVLDDSGLILRDSMAILTYLAKQYDPDRFWLPESLAEECTVIEWMSFAASWIQYGVFTARAAVIFGAMGNGMPADFPVDPREGQIRGVRSLEILEETLAERPWLVGDNPTIADIACFPYIAMAPMGNVSLAPFKAVREWIDRFQTLPKFVSMPGL